MAKPTDEAYEYQEWPALGGPPPKGSVAWVVGVGALEGTGAATAMKFASEGLHVVITGRTEEKLQKVAEAIRAEGGQVSVGVGDVGTEEGLKSSLDIIDSLSEPLVLVAYNAGGSQWRQSHLDMDAEFFEQVWRTNCFGSFLTMREAAQRMVDGKRGGVLLFTGSISGVIARPKLAAYASAKFGQRALAQSMAREFGPRNIHVANLIVHGAIDGHRLNSAFPHAKEARGKDGMVPVELIAQSFWDIACQPRTIWTQEMDIRPWCDEF